MSDQKPQTGLQGSRLPTIGENGAVLLSKEYRDRLIAVVNALCNLEVILPQTDGANVLPPLKATVDISELAMRIILPQLNSTGGGTSTVPFSGSGAPGAGTLSSSYSYVAGPTPSLYVDTTGLNLWVCTTAGTNSTSVWQKVGGGGGGMNYRGYWLSTSTYALNDVVVIQSGTSAGLYISLANSNTNNPASGTNWQQLSGGNTVGAWS